MQHLSASIKQYLKLLKCESLLQTTSPKAFAEYYAYNPKNKNVYNLADKAGNLVGRMVAVKEYVMSGDVFYPRKDGYFSLYIKRLFIKPEYRGQNAGTALLNIARRESLRKNCDGRVHLIAKDLTHSGKHPQIFYRKYGFDSQSKYAIEAIDNAIENNTPLPRYKWETPMYLPCRL